VYSDINIQLVDKSGIPFDARSSDYNDVQVLVKMNSQDQETPFWITSTAGMTNDQVWMPLILVFIALGSSVLHCMSLKYYSSTEQMFFTSKASYMSMFILAVAQFQYFGIFLMIGLNYA
jgi:hypothetical protein